MESPYLIDLNLFDLHDQKIIGSGTFANVFLVKSEKDGRIYAAKIFKKKIE